MGSVNRVDGDFPESAHERLQERVLSSIDTWIDGAYGGTYPRDDFAGAFTTFAEGVVAAASADDALSNASIGTRLEEVAPVRRRVRLDVLGVDGTAVAVTARVSLAFDVTGEVTGGTTSKDKVSGSLYLSYEKSGPAPGWRIFGYDLRRKDL